MNLRLFFPYALIPAIYLLPQSWKDWFQNFTTPEQIPFYALAFGLPHIISSILVLGRREYIEHFRSKLAFTLLASLAVPLICYFSGHIVELVGFYAAYTIYHVIAQQCGIALSIAKLRPSVDWYVWRMSMVLVLLQPFLLNYAPMTLIDQRIGDSLQILWHASDVFLGVLLITTLTLAVKSRKNAYGVAYIGISSLAIFYSYQLISEFQTVLALLLGRVIHDVSGFLVYTQHESRRYADRGQHSPNATVPWVNAGLLNVILSVAIASLITMTANASMLGWLAVSVLGLFHYGIEGFVWKGGSPLRKHVRFA